MPRWAMSSGRAGVDILLFVAALVLAAPAIRAQEADQARAARLMDDLMWGHGHIGGPFKLVDHSGKTRTDAEFRGKLMVVYFGYTTCPDICPTDLIQIGLMLDRLGDAADKIAPLFITVDPERDTTDVLASYVASFHPHLVALTGTREAIRSVAESYKAYYAKYTPPDRAMYLIDHTGFVYLMGTSGEYLGFFPPGTTAERMDEIIRQHLPPSH